MENVSTPIWALILVAIITVGPGYLGLYFAQRSHRAITQNHHQSDPPTIPDRLDKLEKRLDKVIRYLGISDD